MTMSKLCHTQMYFCTVKSLLSPNVFKVQFESFYQTNTCLQKTITCIGLQAEQIFSVIHNIHIFQFWAWLLRFLSHVISKAAASYCEKMLTNFCCILLLYLLA